MTKILWFTGLSGTGKSTLAKILSSKLSQLNFKVKIIDGDCWKCDISDMKNINVYFL
jgi:adenylylsulfate kinase-like enzyme